MLDKSSDPDKVVACIARKCLAFYTILEKRFTSMQSVKHSSPDKILSQRMQVMSIVYHACKFMKLKARKAAARSELDTSMLLRDFEADFLVGLGRVVLSDSPSERDPRKRAAFVSDQHPPQTAPLCCTSFPERPV